MQVAIYMDHPSLLNYATDSTFILGLELQRRGYEIVFLDNDAISWNENSIEFRGQVVNFSQNYPFYHLKTRKQLNLSNIGMILIRKDPPFDMSYITMTYLLERFKPNVLTVNDPVALRNFNDKFLALDLHYLMPPTIVTTSFDLANNFHKEHKDCVVKSLYSSRSRQTFYVKANDANLYNIWHMLLTANQNTPLMVQKFLPQVYEGDKRVFIVDGQVLHAFARVPMKDDFRASMDCGASPIRTELTKREQEVAEEVALVMQKNNILWAGIDLIDGHLMEVNTTSPTGLRVVEELYQVKLEKILVDVMEKKANLA